MHVRCVRLKQPSDPAHGTVVLVALCAPCPTQVHSGGLRHIRTDRRINEWRAPGRRAITRATTNTRQVVIALSGACRALV